MVYNNKAWYLANMRENETAKKLVDKALKLLPGIHTILDTKGFILYNLGQNEDALEIFTDVVGQNPSDAEYWYHKGLVQLKLKDISDALRCFDKSINLDKDFAEAYNAKAVALSKQKKYDESVNELKKAIEKKPELSQAHENLAKAVNHLDVSGQNFWDFWTASGFKIGVMIALSIFAFVLIADPFFYGSETVVIKEENGTKTVTTTLEPKIPDSHLIVLGIIVLIILSPEIKKAKIGPVEFELAPEPSRKVGTETPTPSGLNA